MHNLYFSLFISSIYLETAYLSASLSKDDVYFIESFITSEGAAPHIEDEVEDLNAFRSIYP